MRHSWWTSVLCARSRWVFYVLDPASWALTSLNKEMGTVDSSLLEEAVLLPGCVLAPLSEPLSDFFGLCGLFPQLNQP